MSASALVGIPACAGDTTRLAEIAVDDLTITAPVADVLITSPADGTSLSGTSHGLRLAATVTSTTAPTLSWSKVSGPGSVTFADPSLATTTAAFSATGSYILRLTATTAAGIGSADLTVHVAPAPAADPSLVLHLKLDESSGTTATDSSGSANHATGGLVWQPAAGAITGAADFNGSDSYLAVPDNASLDNTAAFTLSSWFRAETLGNNTGLVAKRVGLNDNNSYGFFLGLDGKLSVDVNSSNNRFTSNTTFNSGTWYHIALVFDGSLAEAQRSKLYVNGLLDTTAAETSTSVPNYASSLHIGVLAPGGNVFNGLIDEIRFHRRALSGPDIAALESATDTFAPAVTTGPAPAAITGIAADLTGTASAEAGPAPTAIWTKISGPGTATFANTNAAATTVTFDQAGTYLLRLTATNPAAQTSADLSVTVSHPPPLVSIVNPPAPVALADAAHVLRLTANASTNGAPGSPAIAWSRLSGPGTVTFANSAAADTTASFSAPGSYLLRCTVTSAGGSASADASVSIAATATLGFRQGENGYSHAATVLRSDSTVWNSGARDQLMVGKSAAAANFFRSVLSFGLTGIPANATLTGISLDLWTHPSQAGTSSVAALELRELAATPVEGSGDSGSDSAVGAGTGATWLNRTATTAWTSPGGDFGPTVLSTVPGFNTTTLGVQKSFPSSAAFLAAAQAALTAGQPLNLMLLSPLTESAATAAFTRIASDDHPTLTQRPRLTLTWSTNPAPVINPGTAPAAVVSQPAPLTGTATGATTSTWSLVSGLGTATFAASNNPATSVTFNQPGSYLLRITASNSSGETSRTLPVEVITRQQNWRFTHFATTQGTGTAADTFDANGDGETNLMEFATAQNPHAATLATPTLVKSGSTLEFTYTRSNAAIADGILFAVE